jgi:hypothetical protein
MDRVSHLLCAVQGVTNRDIKLENTLLTDGPSPTVKASSSST